MLRTSSPYQTCHDLFISYPLAATTITPKATVRTMVLMLSDGDDAGYFVLAQEHRRAACSYSLWPWPDGDIVPVNAETSTIPDMAMKVLTRGVPIPRDGSLLGWTCGGDVTALIVIYANYTPDHPEPGWAVMPLADTPEALWPPFTGDPLLGHWSWEQHRAEAIVSLEGLIAGIPDTVCWVDTTAILGSNCCVVARDITDQAGFTLRQGRYADYAALRAGKPVPELTALLADPDKIDLAPRFQRWSTLGAHR